ncbi:hypothetical protein [Bacillus sp. 37MA]|uniref:hypothetical protein n=1 Tax=Bacillus sp. 37MA TaxID=1132442 RepID=UPI0003A3FA1E|nr:hypothetical protein [Bacillus sp. 37MA]
MILSYDLSFNNKLVLFFIILLLLLKYPFNFEKNKKHFSVTKKCSYFKMLNLQLVQLVLVNAWATRNPNFRGRCGCSSIGACSDLNRGKSYAAVDYNHGVGPGKYNIKVWIKHHGKEYYGKHATHEQRWSSFINAPRSHNLFSTSILTGPSSPGREDYFDNDNNDTHGPIIKQAPLNQAAGILEKHLIWTIL